MDLPTIIVGFLLGTIGFSFFIYGKKQARLPQLVAGIVLMLLPLFTASAVWLAAAGVGVLGGLVFAVKRQW